MSDEGAHRGRHAATSRETEADEAEVREGIDRDARLERRLVPKALLALAVVVAVVVLRQIYFV